MSTSGNRNDDTVRQAKADLKRLGEQSEKMLGARHAEDEDDANDPVVIWGCSCKGITRGISQISASRCRW